MPIYAYRCSSCNHEDDVLQKMSDDLLTICPVCHQDAYRKQLTAPGFQLKGNGWYATDFKGGAGASAESSTQPKSESKAELPPCQGGSGSCACH